MKYNFVPMNLEYATEIIDNWKYEGEYQIYDYSNEKELMLDTKYWGVGMFAVLNGNNLIGEVTMEFYEEEKDSIERRYVEHKVVKDNPQVTYEMWIGWGIKPELCGKGLGKEFVQQCVDFMIKKHEYKGAFVMCGVAAFNKRAIKVYEKVGFEIFHEREGEIANKKQKILGMRKPNSLK